MEIFKKLGKRPVAKKMKKIILLFLLIFSIIGCYGKDKTESEITTQEAPAGKETISRGIGESADISIEKRIREEIIDKGAWGFSIYDPRIKIAEYYTSDGAFLGKRKF